MEIIKTTKMKVNVLFAAVLIVALASCGGGVEQDSLEGKMAELTQLQKQYDELHFQIKELEGEITSLDSNSSKTESGRFVSVIDVKRGKFKHFVELQGVAQSDQNVSVTTDIGGTVLKVLVDEGDRVKKGQVLVVLDDNIIQKQIAELKVALDLSVEVYERQERLWKQNIGSEIQYLQAKNNKESLEKKLESAQAQLAKTRVTSPIDGTIDAVSINAGELASPGYQLVRVVDLSKIEIQADAAENYLTAIRKGDSVQIIFPALRMERKATLDYVGQVIDPVNRTFGVKINLSNKGEALKANLLAVIKVTDYKNDTAIVIPTQYIQQIHGEDVVFVVGKNDAGKFIAVRHNVVTGKTYGGSTEVISGLKVGERVIAEGSRDVANKEEIRVK